MASLHKDPKKRSPFWYCAYTLEDGSRKYRSTKKKIKNEAMKVCVAWATAAGEVGANHRDLEILNEMRKSRGTPPLNLQTVREFLTNWLDGKKNLSSASTERYKTSIGKFLEFLGKEADSDLRNLTAEQIEKFLKSEKDQGISPGTRKMDLKALSSALNLAKRRGLIQFNLAATIEDEVEVRKGKRKAFTPEQISKLLKIANDEWYGFILMGYLTGLRLGDSSTLTWGQIDFSNQTITCTPDKRQKKSTKPPHVEPIHKQLKAWLRGWYGDQNKPGPEQSVFPTLSKKKVHRRNGLSNSFSRLIEEAEIPNPIVREKGEGERGRSMPALSFHSLRYAFNTQLEAADVSEATRMRLSDHSTISVSRGYVDADIKRLLKEINKIPPLPG